MPYAARPRVDQGMRKLGLLLGLGLLPLLGLSSLGLLDYDEAAYGEVARAMLARGDWLVPQLCGVAWFEKPPLLYWSAALGMEAFGVGAVGVRLATALAGAVTPLVLFGFARRPLGERAAFAAALTLAAALEFSALARIAFTDMLLLSWLTLCLGALHRAFEPRAGDVRWLALGCAAAGLAVLTKGVIGAGFPALALAGELALRGRFRELWRPTWIALALLLVLGIGSSWYLALGLTQPGGFAFMRSLFLENHVGRFSRPMQGHGGSLLYYLPVLLVGLFPASPLLPGAIARAGLRGDDERTRFLRLFALFAAIVLAFFSAAATKLPSYALPAFPGCALLVGAWLTRDSGRERALAVSLAVAIALAVLAALGLVLLPELLASPAAWSSKAALHPALAGSLDLGPGCWIAAAVLAGAAGAAAVAWRRAAAERALVALCLGAGATYFVLFLTVAPRVDAQLNAPLRRLAERAASLTRPDEPVLLLGLRHRPSVCFYGARRTHYASEAGGKWTTERLFGPQHDRIGISGEPQLARLPDAGRLEILERDGGYVLFRIPD